MVITQAFIMQGQQTFSQADFNRYLNS